MSRLQTTLLKSLSQLGATWSPPAALAAGDPAVDPSIPHGVQPKLLSVSGVVLLAAGRVGLWLWSCEFDQTKGVRQTWAPVNVAAHHNDLVADESFHFHNRTLSGIGLDAPRGAQPRETTGCEPLRRHSCAMSGLRADQACMPPQTRRW